MIFFKTKLILLLFVVTMQVNAQEYAIDQSCNHHRVLSDNVHNLATHNQACDSSLSARLENFKKWLVAHKESDTEITNDIKIRKEDMTDTALVRIDTTGVIFEGSQSAPIWIIAYVSISCPLCKKRYKGLYESVTSGPLAGIARIGIKPFILDQTNVALVAAGKWHKQAALMNALEPVTNRTTMEIITHITDSLKIPRNEFIKSCQDSSQISYLHRSYAEGVLNEVSSTPTFFINGHRYRSYIDTQWVIDAIEYRNECDCTIQRK
ncbi:MAG: thioredoxin domain-containing protein [Bacillota bacterium]|nr:thioredoxin domain-containing protein [Bacillota bacterium]